MGTDETLLSSPSSPSRPIHRGVISCVAMRRELLRIARVALSIVIYARDTASISSPTLNGSRTLLPTNCAANADGSTEK